MTIIKNLIISLGIMLSLVQPAIAQPDLPGEPVPAPGALPVQIKQMLSLQVSPDGKLVAATFAHLQRFPELDRYEAVAGSMQVWDVATGERKWNVGPESRKLYNVCFSPDSQRLFFSWVEVKLQEEVTVAKLENSRAELRDASTGAVLFPLELEERELVQHAFFTPNGRQVIGSLVQLPEVEGTMGAKAIKKWDAFSGKPLQPSEVVPARENIIDFLPDGQRILTQTTQRVVKGQSVGENKLTVLTWPELQSMHEIPFNRKIVGAKAFSPDGTRIAFGSQQLQKEETPQEVTLHIWDMAKEQLLPLQLVGDGSTHYRQMEFSRDGKTLASGGYSPVPSERLTAKMYFWNAQTGEFQRSFEVEFGAAERGGHSEILTALAPDGNTFFIANGAAKIELRSAQDGTLIRRFE